MNFEHVRPATLNPETHRSIADLLREARLRRYAAELWELAIDEEDYDEAERVAAETETWFEPELER